MKEQNNFATLLQRSKITLSKLRKTKNIFLGQILTSYWCKKWISSWKDQQEQKGGRHSDLVFQLRDSHHSLLLPFFILFSYFSLVGRESCGADDAFASSCFIDWDPSHPEGSQSSPKTFHLSGKVLLLVWSFLGWCQAGNVLLSFCWQCHESPSWRKKSRKPEQRVG